LGHQYERSVGPPESGLHHQTLGTFHKTGVLSKYHFMSYPHRTGSPDRSRSTTVPNVGGFVGISYRFPNCHQAQHWRLHRYFLQISQRES